MGGVAEHCTCSSDCGMCNRPVMCRRADKSCKASSDVRLALRRIETASWLTTRPGPQTDVYYSRDEERKARATTRRASRRRLRGPMNCIKFAVALCGVFRLDIMRECQETSYVPPHSDQRGKFPCSPMIFRPNVLGRQRI